MYSIHVNANFRTSKNELMITTDPNFSKQNSLTPKSQFHIHVDAHKLSPEFEKILLNTHNFTNTDFSGHPEGVLHFETPRHLTYKTQDGKTFNTLFNDLIDYLENHPQAIEGYVEGESIPLDLDLPEKPFNPDIAIPYQFNLKTLTPGTFREDEIHITLEREKSDPNLIQSLRSMGFFSAYMDKPSGSKVEILTVQGTRQQIQEILPELIMYLQQAGGAVNCSIKEERIIRWWTSSADIQLPPVVNSVIPSPLSLQSTSA